MFHILKSEFSKSLSQKTLRNYPKKLMYFWFVSPFSKRPCAPFEIFGPTDTKETQRERFHDIFYQRFQDISVQERFQRELVNTVIGSTMIVSEREKRLSEMGVSSKMISRQSIKRNLCLFSVHSYFIRIIKWSAAFFLTSIWLVSFDNYCGSHFYWGT